MTTDNRPLKGAWGITALLFLFMLINFADKVVVNLAGPAIRAELQLTPTQFGLIGSSFFLLFAISAVLVGFITNRAPTRSILLIMALVWSLVQFPMLGTVSLEVLIACRIVLGAGEGPAAPIATHAAYKWFPDELRGLPTAVIAQGSALGVITAVPLLNWIIDRYSWHWAFGALGIAGLVWAALWLVFGREGTLVDRPVSEGAGSERIPYRHLLTCPSIVAGCCAGFASYWGLALGITWLTSYIVEGLHYHKNLTAVPWLLGSVVVMVGGWLSQRLKTNGASSRVSRGLFPAATVVLGGCLLPFVAIVPETAFKFVLLTIGGAIGSTIYIALPMIVSELTPQPQRAAMLTITTSIITFAGVIAPYVVGMIIADAPSFAIGYERSYVILGCMMIAGGLIGMIFIRPEADRARLAGFAVPSPVARTAQA